MKQWRIIFKFKFENSKIENTNFMILLENIILRILCMIVEL
jgi:hypothetical protein